MVSESRIPAHVLAGIDFGVFGAKFAELAPCQRIRIAAGAIEHFQFGRAAKRSLNRILNAAFGCLLVCCGVPGGRNYRIHNNIDRN